MADTLSEPRLNLTTINSIPILTDDALASSVGVRVAFTQRAGGFSEGPFGSLNLGTHVKDDYETVLRNRRALMEALGAPERGLVVPNQVHGTDLVVISESDDAALDCARREADAGADALVVETSGVTALLCFADCTPVIIVSPTGRFAVVHAGWRGAVAGIAGKSVRELVARDEAAGVFGTASGMNVYVGPHIHVECFETGEDVRARFAETFGAECVEGSCVNLARAVSTDVVRAGVDPARIVVAPFCTRCDAQTYFSYRASGGVCGRHGALAVRL